MGRFKAAELCVQNYLHFKAVEMAGLGEIIQSIS